MAPLSLRIDGQRFRDPQNREVTLRGINFAADSKYPARPDQPSHIDNGFFDGDNVSFVGRPFAVSDAPQHLERLKRWGYNTIRYIFTWEAIEHAGPGQYDEEWIQSTIEVLRLIKSYGFYVFMDPHQDVVRRDCQFTCFFFETDSSYSGQDSLAALGLQCGHFMPPASIQLRSKRPKRLLFITPHRALQNFPK